MSEAALEELPQDCRLGSDTNTIKGTELLASVADVELPAGTVSQR